VPAPATLVHLHAVSIPVRSLRHTGSAVRQMRRIGWSTRTSSRAGTTSVSAPNYSANRTSDASVGEFGAEEPPYWPREETMEATKPLPLVPSSSISGL
jgi:hypothetical protein